MIERHRFRSVGRGIGPDPPSALFQELSSEFPELPRRVVGDVLSQVYGRTWESTTEIVEPGQVAAAARGLLDAIRARAVDAARRTGLAPAAGVVQMHPRDSDGLSVSSLADRLREALDPDHELRELVRAERLADVIEAQARRLGVATSLSLLCEMVAHHLTVAAAAVSVPGGLLSAQTVGAAGPLARPLEELQVVLGEGPTSDGLVFGNAVLVTDLAAPEQQSRWPLYAAAAITQGARAQFVLPMQVGAARFGVLVLYADRVAILGSKQMDDARVFAEVALGWLIDDVAGGSSEERTEARGRLPLLDDRAEIHQATGMASVQLGVDLSTALLRLRARAFAEDRPLSDLAFAVVARTVRFRPESARDEHEDQDKGTT